MSQPSSPAAPLRVGLLLAGTRVPGWQAGLIDKLLHAPYCRIELAVYLPAPTSPSSSRRDRFAGLGAGGTSLARWYLAFEQRWTGSADDPLAATDIAARLHGIPSLTVTRLPRRERLQEDDCDRIMEAQLDVILRLGSPSSRCPAAAATYGVWSLQLGDADPRDEDVQCFREVWTREPVSSIAVHMVADDSGGAVVLGRTSTPTRLGSVAESRRAAYRLGANLIARLLEELHARGPQAFRARVGAAEPPVRFHGAPASRLPSNIAFPSSLVRHWWGKATRRFQARTTQRQWMLLYQFGRELTSLHRFHPLRPPADRFWADPFVLVEGGTHYVFFEELEYAVGRGHISAISIQPDGTVSPPIKVLERPYHLSYPSLVRWGGELYMVPETGDRGTLEAYRCVRFPDQWEFYRCLMHRPLYDATLFEWENRWWLFATATRELCDTELHLFFAESPLSELWTPHPANPVVSDLSRARPAGNLFTRNGGLYRPAQDSSRYYGYALRIQEVVALNPDEYRERDSASIVPDWDPAIVGLHHLSFSGDLTVVDAQIQRRRWPGSS